MASQKPPESKEMGCFRLLRMARVDPKKGQIWTVRCLRCGRESQRGLGCLRYSAKRRIQKGCVKCNRLKIGEANV